VKLGGRPFGKLRPALAWRDDLRENDGSLDGVRGPADKGKELLVPRPRPDGTSSRANDVYRRTWRTAASHEGCQFPTDDKGKGKEISLLATFNV
jgi:hypothetical protein